MPSRQALELLQVRQMRSPGQLLRNSSRHLRHLRSLASYLRSGSGFEFFSELLMARIYSSSFSKMRHICCTAKGLFIRPVRSGRGRRPPNHAPIRRTGADSGGHQGGVVVLAKRERSAIAILARVSARDADSNKKNLATLSTIAKTGKIEAELNVQKSSDRE